ncbi:MAG: putative replication factor C small subunit [Satyrvirus sp.]|uniref:Putative replication factor C small subunit n=1 Tax=Satyrvirus sp. TaxID=2487771 RepID=A0A3G5AEY4_9VIRU|nr:MAG: putative replication factor C small subunit [Satyrvirus sp.]
MSFYENISVDRNDVYDKKLPWVEKYRPKHIGQIISHNENIQSLTKFIDMKTLPHLLFFGPSGSGKTSTIMCCANEIYGNKYVNCMVLQLNASNERGIETVRTKIKNFVSNRNSIFLPPHTRNIFKLVILDEIDSMTVEAQGMLRQTIEKNSMTTRFCLICNDIDKINIALQSRCTLYRFAPLNTNDMKKKLNEICEIEKIKYDSSAIDAIIKISKGDMRSAINILQHVNLTIDKKITAEHVYKVTGHCMPTVITDIFNDLTNLSKKKINLCGCINSITNKVVDNNITIFNLLGELKNIIIDSKLEMDQKIFLIDNFAKNEIYDAVNVDPKNILMIITSLFVIVPNIKN